MKARHQPPVVPGFELGPLLGEGATSRVYYATREGQSYAVKVLKAIDDPGATVRIRREAAALARLEHPGLVRVVEFGEQQGTPFIVMELVGGRPLSELLGSGRLVEAAVVRLAKELASALSAVHRRGLLHGDLKPANVIIEDAGRARIIDFSFAATADDSPAAGGPLLGTIAYAAPEQLGLIKRPVDGRADLYGLGSLLYECATGRPPFVADTATQLLNLVRASSPHPASELNPEIRPVLSQILAKLLAKDPDDRYQTAEGLVSDLEDLERLHDAFRSGQPLELGRQDGQARFAEVPLTGRARELSAIGDLWRTSAAGRGAVLQVEGEGGSGKTRLVRELMRLARADGALVLAGKCRQGERTPFGPLREALDDYLERLRRLPERERDPALQKVRQAAGDFGGLVRRLSRSLERVLAEAPEVPPLDAAAEQERFYDKLAEFFVTLAGAHGPSLMLVDDVQWLDDGSLEVLRKLAGKVHRSPLLIATTARNDAESDPARRAFLEKLGDELVQRVSLEPLDLEAVGALVAAHLGGKPLERSQLERLNARTRGNPLAIGEHLRALLDEGLLRPSLSGWSIDESRLRELSLPTDVVDLLVKRLQPLDRGLLQILGTAAVIGFEFDPALLVEVTDDRQAVQRALEAGVREGIIEQGESHFAFVHDRVYEAVLKRLGEAELPDIHQRVAEALERRDDPSPLVVHAMARHYAAGRRDRNPLRLYETCLAAGMHALETFSNEQAYELLSLALETSKGLSLAPADLCRLHEHLGSACARTGRLERAHEHYDLALASPLSRADWARLHYLKGQAYTTEGQNLEAWESLQGALRMHGAAFPRLKLAQALSLLWHWVIALFRSSTRWGFGSAVGLERARRRAVSQIHDTLNLAAYLLSEPLLLFQVGIRELHNAQFLGVSREAAKSHAFHSASMGLLGFRASAERHREVALVLARQIGDREVLAYCEYLTAMGLDFVGDIIRGQAQCGAIAAMVRKHARPLDAATFAAHHAFSYVLQGKAREALGLAREYADQQARLGTVMYHSGLYGFMHSQLNLLGRVPEAIEARKQQERLAARVPAVYTQAFLHLHRMFVLLDQEDFGPEVEREIEAFLRLGIQDYHCRMGYVIVAHIRLAQLLRATKPQERRRLKALVLRALRAAESPFLMGGRPVFSCHVEAIRAALACEEGRFRRSARLLRRAEGLAKQAGSIWGAWVATRQWARLAAKQGDGASALQHARAAWELARREGWLPRLAQLEREFPLVAKGDSSDRGSASTPRSDEAARLAIAERQLDAVFRASVASASSLEPVQQGRAALDELVSIMGAERAFLFENDEATGAMRLVAGRDAERHDLTELTGYSSTVVKKVQASGQPLVVTGTEQGEALGSESAVMHELRSIMAAPLQLGEKLLGVVYLDSRLAKGLFDEGQLRILQAISNHVAVAMHTTRMARLEAERKDMEQDMALTATVQALFVPRTRSCRIDSARLVGSFLPATRCSGDWWWFEQASDGRLIALVGDVTGHGAAAAMVTASVAGAMRVLWEGRSERDVGGLLQQLNRTLNAITQGDYTMTLGAVEVSAEGRLRYWSAGGPPLVLVRAGRARPVLARGAPLGSSPTAFVGQGELSLEQGDRVFLYTDGLLELELPDGRQLGMGRLAQLTEALTADIEAVPNDVSARIKALRGELPQNDDITFVVVEYSGALGRQDEGRPLL